MTGTASVGPVGVLKKGVYNESRIQCTFPYGPGLRLVPGPSLFCTSSPAYVRPPQLREGHVLQE